MKIRYFAWLRERLNKNEEEVDPPASVRTIADLIGWLAARDDGAGLAFANPKILRAAIDAEIVGPEALIGGGKIVALFPPR